MGDANLRPQRFNLGWPQDTSSPEMRQTSANRTILDETRTTLLASGAPHCWRDVCMKCTDLFAQHCRERSRWEDRIRNNERLRIQQRGLRSQGKGFHIPFGAGIVYLPPPNRKYGKIHDAARAVCQLLRQTPIALNNLCRCQPKHLHP